MEDKPDVPEPLLRRSKRNRAQTRTDVSIVESVEESADEFVKRRRKPSRPRTGEAAPSTTRAKAFDHNLIEVVKSNGKCIPQVVKSWVERYEKDPKPAMVELLTMLFEACGVTYHIQGELSEVDDIVVALVNLAAQSGVEDFLNSERKELTSFKENLVSFWDNLVSECQNGPLFDRVLFDKCMDYVVALSCTPPRVYRHVASVVGLQLVTSFMGAAKILADLRQTTERQLAAEKRKGSHIESLHKRLSEMNGKVKMIEEMMCKIFKGLFVVRCRDIDPEIRMPCIQSLGTWIISYPSLFLQDSYIKYLGWALGDKDAGVRKASVLALQNLYDVDDNVPVLESFTETFAKRMWDLAYDTDLSIAVCGISLVNQLLRRELVSDALLGSLYDLLTDDSPEIRHAIGALVYDHVVSKKLNNSQSPSSGDSSHNHLVRMLELLIEYSADQTLCTYLIDNVWEFMDAMKDWKRIISMLLDDNPSIQLTDDAATNLTRLFCASVKKAVGEMIIPITDHRIPTHTKAQREMIERNREEITTAMMDYYPQLIRRYMVDKMKVPSLVEIILYMDLELYSLKRKEQSFQNVFEMIIETFFKHGDNDALRACVKAIGVCSTGSKGELQDFAQNRLKMLEEELIVKLKAATKEVVDGGEEYSLLVNMKRLYELQLSRHVPIDSLYDDMAMVLKKFRHMDDEVVSFLLLNMHLHVSWCLYSVMHSEVVSEESLSSLVSKRNMLFRELDYFLQIPSEPRNLVGGKVCAILAETWLLFRKQLFDSTPLESLGYSPDSSTLTRFWNLSVQQLDVSEEETADEEANKEHLEETEDEEEHVEETSRVAVMIAAAKLVSTGVSKDFLAPKIISRYVMHGPSVAEVVKNLIIDLMQKNKDVSDIFVGAMKQAYGRYMASNSESLSGQRLKECKDLSVALSEFFVGARVKCRAVILKIMRHGIAYAFSDQLARMPFLMAALIAFASRLAKSDTRTIIKDLEDRTRNEKMDDDPSGWAPYKEFIACLHGK